MEIEFKQSSSQGAVVLVIIVGTLLFLGITFAALVFSDGNEVMSFSLSMVGFAVVAAGIFFFVRKKLLVRNRMWIGRSGFTVLNLDSGKERKFKWEEIKKFKSGYYSTGGIAKHYLWIWPLDGSPAIHIEDDGSEEARLNHYLEFREAAIAYLEHARDNPVSP